MQTQPASLELLDDARCYFSHKLGFDVSIGESVVRRRLVRQIMGRVLAMRQLSATIQQIEAGEGIFSPEGA